jgi:hypothetical protein
LGVRAVKPPLPNAKPAAAPPRVLPTRPPTAEERRRAQRVLLKIKVNVHLEGKPMIEGFTHTVSASGAMLILPQGLPEGTKVTVENPKAAAKAEARVVRPAQINQEGSLVPVEFTAPAPNFWGIFFPPVIN